MFRGGSCASSSSACTASVSRDRRHVHTGRRPTSLAPHSFRRDPPVPSITIGPSGWRNADHRHHRVAARRTSAAASSSATARPRPPRLPPQRQYQRSAARTADAPVQPRWRHQAGLARLQPRSLAAEYHRSGERASDSSAVRRARPPRTHGIRSAARAAQRRIARCTSADGVFAGQARFPAPTADRCSAATRDRAQRAQAATYVARRHLHQHRGPVPALRVRPQADDGSRAVRAARSRSSAYPLSSSATTAGAGTTTAPWRTTRAPPAAHQA